MDHGKTSLVGLLSGVDTDRLPEEKQRGLSIDLGFAYLPVPDGAGQIIGFVDVPGHEKFIKNMIAGVGTVNLALLVIAADDGLMPQSVEHLSILKLLGVPRVVPVISKIDLVTDARVDAVKESISSFLHEQDVAVSSMFMVSTEQPESIDRLRDFLILQASAAREADVAGHFRLAVDRCFSVSGAGTVVTGTVLSGVVRAEDAIHQADSNAAIRVRRVRAQSIESPQASAGQRCALNLSGANLRRRLPLRGDCLTNNPFLKSTRLLDVELNVIGGASAPQLRNKAGFSHWTPCHFYVSTTSATCRVALLQTDILYDGEQGYARVYCDKPVWAVAGDRFVLRDQSARHTVAGGRIIDPLAPARGRGTAARLMALNAMNQAQPELAFAELVALNSSGVDIEQFIARFNCTREEIAAFADGVSAHYEPGAWILDSRHWNSLRDTILAVLARWHSEHPLLLGASEDQIVRMVKPRVMNRLAAALLDRLVEDQLVSRKGAVFRLQSWTSQLDDKHELRWSQIEPMIAAAGSTAPRVVEIADALEIPADDVLSLLNTFVAHGRLFRVSANRYYLSSQLLELGQLAETLARNETLTVANFRDESTIGRNLVVELLEFFDRCRFTRRVGQHRRVVQSAESVFGP